MTYDFSVVTAPTEYPVSLAEAKAHLRTGNDEDDLISSLIATAVDVCESGAHRAFVTQALSMVFASWPKSGEFTLLRPPLVSVDFIKYFKANGTLVTVDSGTYQVETTCAPGKIILAYNKTWPADELRPGYPISVQYVAGYGDAADVPARYKQAIKLLVGHWYENREATLVSQTSGSSSAAELPLAVRSLLTIKRGKW